MPVGDPGGPSVIRALLGPTNTGKTHRAIGRMLEHDSGMIGLPLRLLAREVYDRVVAAVGAEDVALCTGEEKRIPRRARYWVCTVEAMPMDRAADFMAVDEIQLGAHRERGHVFTDRLLHARGRRETWFMGADTMRPIMKELVPTAEISSQPRLSQLRSSGASSMAALPPRTAVVAFSMARVYELAERLRRRRGGAAVVLGALSPRARNAQVALYESGEVDYMVATDAIGMGLNMNVHHVAFADSRKFDGREARLLELTELAQIAGRAGRYLADGTFGTVSPLPAFDERVIHDIENHRFADVARLMWRSSDLEMSTIDELLASLKAMPRSNRLRKAEPAEDERALSELGAMPDVRQRARGREAVELLWEVCRIPDFQQLLVDHHARLLRDIYLQLAGATGRLSPDWVRQQIERLDATDGGIDELLRRLAFIRTWTYVTHRGAWIDDSAHWQQLTRDVEDRLSDALHERLVQRFVDRGRRRSAGGPSAKPRTRRKNDSTGQGAEANAHGPFFVLQAMRDAMAARDSSGGEASPGLGERVDELLEVDEAAWRLERDGRITADGRLVGRLTRGSTRVSPHVVVAIDGELSSAARARVRRQLETVAKARIVQLLEPLREDPEDGLSPAARGVLYQLEGGLGTTLTARAKAQLCDLTPQDRAVLKRMGIVIGDRLVQVPRLGREPALAVRVALTAARTGVGDGVEWPRADAPSIASADVLDDEDYLALGYERLGPRAVRADRVEQALSVLRRASRGRSFEPERLSQQLSASAQELVQIARRLGFDLRSDEVRRIKTARDAASRRAGSRPRRTDH